MEIEKLLLAMEERINERFNTLEEKIDNIAFKLDSLEAKNAINHLQLIQDIHNINIVNAKNNFEIANLKRLNRKTI